MHTSLTLFYSARSLEEKEDNPNWRFKLAISPFVLMDLIGSVASLCLLAEFFRRPHDTKVLIGVLSACGVGSSIILNFIFHAKMKYYENNTSLKFQESSEKQMQNSGKQNLEMLQLNALTSWIVNTVVVNSTMRVHLFSLTVSTTLYLALIATGLEFQKLHPNSFYDFSVLVCIPRTNIYKDANFTTIKDVYTRIDSSFVDIVYHNQYAKHVARVCDAEEQPLEKLSILVAATCTLLILKVLSGAVLYVLSDYRKLIKYLKFLRMNTFHYIDIIENPKEYENDSTNLMELFSQNIDSLNRQHPVNGKTIMHIANQIFSPDDIKKLNDLGASMNIRDFDGKTPKESWCEIERLDPESKHGKRSSISPIEKDDHSPLLRLLHGNKYMWFQWWVFCGGRLDGKDSFGRTIFEHLAFEAEEKAKENYFPFLKFLSYKDVLEMLVHLLIYQTDRKVENLKSVKDSVFTICKNQKDISKENKWVDKLKSRGVRSDVVKFFRQNKLKDNKDILELLHIFYNQQDILHFACRNGRENLLALLLELDLDPNAPDSQGDRPLHLACEEGQVACVTLLLSRDKRADVNQRGQFEWTPLHKAAYGGHVECVRILLENGATIDSKSYHGETPLHEATKKGHLICVKHLLSQSARLNDLTNEEETPLHHASKSGHSDCVNFLLEAGADYTLKNKDGKTALDLAIKSGHSKCVKYLLDKNADIEETRNQGETSSIVAPTDGQHESGKIFEK